MQVRCHGSNCHTNLQICINCCNIHRSADGSEYAYCKLCYLTVKKENRTEEEFFYEDEDGKNNFQNIVRISKNKKTNEYYLSGSESEDHGSEFFDGTTL